MNRTTKHRILQFISSKKISKTTFLQETNIKRGFLDKDKLSGSVSDILLSKIIETYPEVSLEWLITGAGNMVKTTPSSGECELPKNDTDPIPLFTLDKISNVKHPGPGSWKSSEYVTIPHMPPCDAAVYIQADTMYPILRSGDIVMYKRLTNLEDVYLGEMYILDIERPDDDNYLTLKYIFKSDLGDDYFSLHSYNPIYPPQDILKSRIQRLGLIKACIRYNSLL